MLNLILTRTATRSCRTRKRALNVYSPGVAAAPAAVAAASAASAIRQLLINN